MEGSIEILKNESDFVKILTLISRSRFISYRSNHIVQKQTEENIYFNECMHTEH